MKIEEIIKMLPEEYEKACWETQGKASINGVAKPFIDAYVAIL